MRRKKHVIGLYRSADEKARERQERKSKAAGEGWCDKCLSRLVGFVYQRRHKGDGSHLYNSPCIRCRGFCCRSLA